MRIHFTASLKFVLSIHHHNVSRSYSAGNGRHVILGERNCHGTYFDGLVRFDHEHITALRPVLNRHRRNDSGVFVRFQQQADIDELIGPKNVVLVVEHRLQAAGAGRLVDLIVDGEQFSRGDLGLVVPAVGFNRRADPDACGWPRFADCPREG